MSHEIEKDWVCSAGYRCVVLKMTRCSYHRCGYVGIPEGHLLYGRTYSEDIPELHDKWNDGKGVEIGKRGSIPVVCYASSGKVSMDILFDVHGSVTFSDGGPYPVASQEGLWWIGFDCNHCDDRDNPKSLDYCIQECESLARQLKDVEGGE